MLKKTLFLWVQALSNLFAVASDNECSPYVVPNKLVCVFCRVDSFGILSNQLSVHNLHEIAAFQVSDASGYLLASER